MFFVGINILEVIKLNNSSGKNWKNEIIVSLESGTIVGVITSMVAFVCLNIWFLLFLPVNNFFALSITATIWICLVMSSTLYYRLSRKTIYKYTSFLVGLLISIGLMNTAYRMLTFEISLPYSSLRTSQIIAFVLISTAIGLAIKVIAEPKEIAQ